MVLPSLVIMYHQLFWQEYKALYLPGNFHESKGSMYGNLYWHYESLKDPFVIVAGSAFQATTGDFAGKIKNG